MKKSGSDDTLRTTPATTNGSVSTRGDAATRLRLRGSSQMRASGWCESSHGVRALAIVPTIHRRAIGPTSRTSVRRLGRSRCRNPTLEESLPSHRADEGGAMKGLMQDYPLTLPHLFHRGERLFPDKEVVTATATGRERTTYGEWAERTRRLGGVLDTLGLSPDARVATFAWNTARHLELYFAVPCTGRVLHTLNIRLFPDCLGIRESDVILPVVPMFHANAWGLAHAGVFAGATLVFPGADLSPPAVADLIESERVTVAAGVPTIWMGVLRLLEGRDTS